MSVKELALCLSPGDLRRVRWREGTRGTMHSRFACLRVRVAHRDYRRGEPHPEQWLLIEWPEEEKEPKKYWLSNLPESIPLRRLVLLAKQRWVIERDYRELKQELGLGHFEGRGWRGFHHHASLAIAVCGSLARERCLSPLRRASRCGRPISAFRYHVSKPATRPAALSARTERHNPYSITTQRRQIAVHLARSLPRCPCSLRDFL